MNYLQFIFLFILVACGQNNFNASGGSTPARSEGADQIEVSEPVSTQAPSHNEQDDSPPVDNPILNPTDNEVSSIWYTDDYKCLFQQNQEEIIKISRIGNLLRAVKTIGTNCIKANEVTWEARIDPTTNTGSGFLFTNLPIINKRGKVPVTVTIKPKQISVMNDDYQIVFDLQSQK